MGGRLVIAALVVAAIALAFAVSAALIYAGGGKPERSPVRTVTTTS